MVTKMSNQIEIVELGNDSFEIINGYTGEISPVIKHEFNDFSYRYGVSFTLSSGMLSSCTIVFDSVAWGTLRDEVEKFFAQYCVVKAGA